MKSRTRCHLCKQIGHWKRECPQKKGASSSGVGGAGKKEAMMAEVHVVEEGYTGQGVWQLFEQVPKNVTWQESQSDDVGNIGFADAHATGNRQRQDLVKPGDPGKVEKSQENTVMQFESPTLNVFPSRHFVIERQEGCFETHFSDHEQEVLSADQGVVESVKREAGDGNCAVIDSACRRTLIGEYTLQHLEQHLLKHNLRTVRRDEQCEFRFGNSGTLVSREAVLIPACVGDRKFLIKAAILPAGGSWTPLLLSKEFMKQLGIVLNTVEDSVEFRRLGKTVKLRINGRGHYVVPLFCFGGVSDCLAVEGNSHRKNHERSFAISELEKSERFGVSDSVETRDLAEPCNADVHWQSISMEETMIVQMMNQMGSMPVKMVDGEINPKDLDHHADQPQDGMKNPIPSQEVLKEGKYAKRKNPQTMEAMYVNDKGYTNWVRNHITETSAVGMQRFRVYIYHRDQEKQARIKKEIKKKPTMEIQEQQMPVNYSRAAVKGRIVLKSMRSRPAPEDSGSMPMDWQYQDQESEFEMVNHTEVEYDTAILQKWSYLFQMRLLMKNEEIEKTEEYIKEQCSSQNMAKFVVNLAHA